MGKIAKNIILILVGFLVISMVFSFFGENKKVTTVKVSEISALLNQEKVESLTITDGAVTAKLKDSDVLQQAKVGVSTDPVDFFKNTGVDPAKLSPDKVKIEYGTE